jgi:subtilisin family serine protease
MALHGSKRRMALALGITGAAMAATVAVAGQAWAEPVSGQIRLAATGTAVQDSYIVVFKDGVSATSVDATAHRLTARHGGTVRTEWSDALHGFELAAPAQSARRLAADPSVAYVEQNATVHVDATQANPPSWGLDRIDQRDLPLSWSYSAATTAAAVHAYIIDTGIHVTHTDFGGRATAGFDAVTKGGKADDCNGHGTHVSGTVGGSKFGVAKGVQLVAVRVLDCNGSGTNAQVISGVNWVTKNAKKPAVANMSLGGGANTALDNAVAASIKSGVTYAIAAGNSNANACTQSPARVPTAITVGATDKTDARASFSNFGTCVDIFAPGVGITSAWNASNTATNTISGTSMATPHVTGAAALVLAAHTGFTPAQVTAQLVADATTGKVRGPGTGSPNRLLFVH